MADGNEKWMILLTIIINSLAPGNGTMFSATEEANIISIVEAAMECRHVPGLTLSVVKGDETWTRGFGFADLTSGQPVTNETKFGIGSLAKAFTMTLLGTLIQNTGYTWETRLSDIEGLDLEFIDDEITRDATLSDLLAHRTGLSSVTDYGFIGGYPTSVDRKYLSKRTKYIPQASDFRTSFLYNNMMYMLLGYLSELLGKDSWENLVTSRVFEPIGMESTTILLTDDDILQPDVAKPYIKPGDELENGNYNIYRIANLEPAGSILSNANDMAKWIRFNLRNGSTHTGQQLINKELLLEAWQDKNTLPFGGIFHSLSSPPYPVNATTNSYGYAWFTSYYRGFKRLWHSGGFFSYVSLIWLFPDQHIGIYANVNGPATVREPGYALNTILYYVSDILLGQTPWISQGTVCTYPSPWLNTSQGSDTAPEPDNFTNENLADFAGTFGNMLLPDIRLSVKERESGETYIWLEMNRIKGELLLTADSDQFRFKMVEPWEYAIERVFSEHFTITYPVEFKRSDNGLVESFELKFSTTDVMNYKKGVRFEMVEALSTSRCVEGSLKLLLAINVIMYAIKYN